MYSAPDGPAARRSFSVMVRQYKPSNAGTISTSNGWHSQLNRTCPRSGMRQLPTSAVFMSVNWSPSDSLMSATVPTRILFCSYSLHISDLFWIQDPRRFFYIETKNAGERRLWACKRCRDKKQEPAPGVASLGTTIQMKGIVLSQTAITLNTGASVNGRLLAQTAVTLISNAVTQP
jgi:hypothetical protein